MPSLGVRSPWVLQLDFQIQLNTLRKGILRYILVEFTTNIFEVHGGVRSLKKIGVLIVMSPSRTDQVPTYFHFELRTQKYSHCAFNEGKLLTSSLFPGVAK